MVTTMSIKELKEREKEQRREYIIDAAEKLFFSKGYDNVSMNDIADAVEMNKATLYLYFENKDALYFAIVLRGSAHHERGCSRRRSPEETTGIGKIGASGEAYLEFNRKYPHYYRLFHFAGTDRFAAVGGEDAAEVARLSGERLRHDGQGRQRRHGRRDHPEGPGPDGRRHLPRLQPRMPSSAWAPTSWPPSRARASATSSSSRIPWNLCNIPSQRHRKRKEVIKNDRECHRGQEPREKVREIYRRRRISVRRGKGRGLRFSRPQRGGQDDDGRDTGMPEDAHLRRRQRPGPRHPQGRDEDQAGHRRDAPELQRLRLADGLREHRLLRPDVLAPRGRGRADQDVRPGREAERAVQEPVRRPEAARRHRHRAGQRPGDRVPRRADDRPGPAGTAGRLGSDQSPEEPRARPCS